MNLIPDRSTFTDPPFGVPPDVVLDIPVPPSVNETRKINHAARGKLAVWKAQCDMALMASGQFRFAAKNKPGDRFEIVIILNEQLCNQDADNPIKSAIDYVRRLELVKDDDKRYLRHITVRWGEAPEGCRILLRPYVEAA